jgi:GNAT superfamily N-acetyltransferase
MSAGWRLRPARREELSVLQDIEDEADLRYGRVGLAMITRMLHQEIGMLEAGRRKGWLWVAADAVGRPAGWALLRDVHGHAWLHQLSVLQRFGQQGIGTALVEATCAVAAHAGYREIFLSTARQVPWNEPFYARRGFIAVPEDVYWLRQERMQEIRLGHVPWRRVIMRRALGA